jgi:hypothetical protein
MDDYKPTYYTNFGIWSGVGGREDLLVSIWIFPIYKILNINFWIKKMQIGT